MPKTNIWKRKPGFGKSSKSDAPTIDEAGTDGARPAKWSFGVLNPLDTDEVPGSILLISTANHNEPLGLQREPARTSASSLPSPHIPRLARQPSKLSAVEEKKRTADGDIILEPQPDESLNDPLNWPVWRRDSALLSLGFYCMVGGGMTPILAAGFNNVAATYNVSIPQVALTTGLYMMGLGVGSVIASPTAILFGKRPIYLVGAILFIISSVWCAASPNYTSLVVARVVQGMSVSPVECLPSATIAEIFFLHERAYRVGIYTLLLLSGKNLVPLVSAAIIQSLGWRWVFWIVAMVVGFCFGLIFLFVPETFWDRTPRAKTKRPALTSRSFSSLWQHKHHGRPDASGKVKDKPDPPNDETNEKIDQIASQDSRGGMRSTLAARRLHKTNRIGVNGDSEDMDKSTPLALSSLKLYTEESPMYSDVSFETGKDTTEEAEKLNIPPTASHRFASNVDPTEGSPPTSAPHNFNSPFDIHADTQGTDYLGHETAKDAMTPRRLEATDPVFVEGAVGEPPLSVTPGQLVRYTTNLRHQPPRTFVQALNPWNGRLQHESWWRVAFRPFILFAYPAVLWSTVVYSLSIGWLIVLSESVADIYRSRPYGFSALSTGLIYVSPFIGGILGTAVAGKVSDIIVRDMSRRNGGVYEPEFRLVMAIPVAIATAIGLMGYGWSADVHDKWIVPTIFFGVISFGCSLGSTTAITFCVDSYRQYAGEALVTLNFSKNIFHGLAFSLFFNRWLAAKGPKSVFTALGGIQLGCLLFTIPMFIYGKRARMWTTRKNFMEKF